MSAPRVRIAPSPTGDPHVGTAYVALFNSAYARRNGGTFILRIDDTDRSRYDADSEAMIQRALRWLGFEWQEGPDVGGAHAPYRQSERLDIYRQRVRELIESGAAYRCFCTPERLAQVREEQKARKQDQLGYDGTCRELPGSVIEQKLASGTSHVVRLRVPDEGTTSFHDELRGQVTFENRAIDDQVLLKSDGYPTYHMANVTDDIAFGITDVIRAEEWVVSTPKHVLLYQAFGAPLPRFFHVPLLRNSDQSKISKRKNPVSLDYYREQGYLPEALLNFLANMGWSSPTGKEVFDMAHFTEHFRPEDINLGSPVFDLVKLRWLNGVHLRALTPEQLLRALDEGGFLPEGAGDEDIARLLPLVGERLHLLGDFQDQTRFYFAGPDAFDAEGLLPKKRDGGEVRAMLERVGATLADAEPWDAATVAERLDAVRGELGFKKPEVFMPVRMALTGRKDAPGVFELCEVLGRDTVLERVAAAARILDGSP